MKNRFCVEYSPSIAGFRLLYSFFLFLFLFNLPDSNYGPLKITSSATYEHVLTLPESQSANSLKDIYVQAHGSTTSASDGKHLNCSLLDRFRKNVYSISIEQSLFFDHHLFKNSSITMRMVSAVLVV